MSILMSIVGIFTLLTIGFLFSENRKSINKRTVILALIAQIGFGAFVMFVPIGEQILQGMANGVNHVISYANEGLGFAFGDIAKFKMGFIFVINVLCVIIFISALISVLYYLNIMQALINVIGGVLTKLLGTSRAESLSATANIFVGPIEAPSMIRPLVKNMTRSELFAVMTGGLASVAGGTMVGYISLGVDPKYIITACFMTAPAGLLFAKLLCPQTEEVVTDEAIKVDSKDAPKSLLDAITEGSLVGMQQVATVTALVISFVALIALLNGIVSGVGGLFGFENVSLELIIGYALSPLAFLMGVPWDEAVTAAALIGKKIAVNEFVAYMSYVEISETLSEKTRAIIVFSLCGFANIGSLAMVIGGIGAMSPDRRPLLVEIGPRVLLGAILANLMSGTIAGLLITLS
ncbi:NupC/NupG family nucleoside CNT transporter [Vibrio sp. SCSIO 43135]|uniref:NupC/NupG family nucleoside CNT transporter n=1 Tax=Vibrio paucivorans TaxID=2829489 RepID=A0A9X3CC46_9VIBR|nr:MULTISPECIES: NupC/NupG family nucleoside CNT transporter [Vibrio]MCW8332609.1 NupC/NupG family nucleoside CNT transporter [Vibrio paucivorans]USD42724.1 NupC/NupG family nucleoside CNT transporter [Vibrio sp. SCSIO 43135]